MYVYGEGNGNPLQYSCLGIPGSEEPGGLPSVGSHRVGHDWSDLAVQQNGCIESPLALSTHLSQISTSSAHFNKNQMMIQFTKTTLYPFYFLILIGILKWISWGKAAKGKKNKKSFKKIT